MNGHSMHFHGVEYEPSSDGAYVPGVSDPYHGHSSSMRGMIGTYRVAR